MTHTKNYFLRFIPFLVIFLVIQIILRGSLLLRGMNDLDFTSLEIVQIFLRGLWLDIATVWFVLLPIALVYSFAPSKIWSKRNGKILSLILSFLLIFSLLFDLVAEHLFWSEFTTRFNFIAVDYLVYTQEVMGNISESYPVLPIIVTIGIIAVICTWIVHRNTKTREIPVFKYRVIGFLLYVIFSGIFYRISDVSQAQFDDNTEATEIASNGIYSLFHAFWHNEISYDRFYLQHKNEKVQNRIQNLFSEEEGNFENGSSLIRIINPKGKELHKNVILVSMESMSASYMQHFGNSTNLTPNLDKLASEGLFFTNLYATGTRTVRGLEAMTLSVPPTPGQSILRRPGNDNLFSLGFVFKDRGYDTKFVYGGYGYFDNMNTFFAGNGFDVVDRTSMTKEEVNFANVWGVADDDLFARAIKEADKSYAAGKPFMQLVMTTSNHRPYTYPEGRIDIPSKTGGRSGGVKYADYSIGKLIEWAKKKPWYKDTVFIFVADHTAGAGGKAELDPIKYHIPMIFYSPGFIKPSTYDKMASQIDLAPILLGQLNFHYRTKFYGEDLLHDDDEIPHAFISNYQKIALMKNGDITILEPKRRIEQYNEATGKLQSNTDLIDDTVAYYQSASWWKEIYKRESTLIK